MAVAVAIAIAIVMTFSQKIHLLLQSFCFSFFVSFFLFRSLIFLFNSFHCQESTPTNVLYFYIFHLPSVSLHIIVCLLKLVCGFFLFFKSLSFFFLSLLRKDWKVMAIKIVVCEIVAWLQMFWTHNWTLTLKDKNCTFHA